MNTITKTPKNLAQVKSIIDQLPDGLKQDAQNQLVQRVEQTNNLQVSLVGAFSVGKSSLLNMLMNETWLHAAQEEATALPTVIEYAPEQNLYVVQQDGQQQSLDRDGFTLATTQAPTGAQYAMLQLPQPWLQQLSIIDLPGLGSTSAQNYKYTLTQIQQSDSILYLLAPRGPSASDLEMLSLIRQYGKAVCLVVARWDEVEQSIARGEKAPDLNLWQQQIEKATGINQQLITASNAGLGRELIQQFLQNCREQLDQIRLNRFVAEIYPELQNAFQLNEQSQQACEAQTEAQIQQHHEKFQQLRSELIEAKALAYQNQQAEQTQLEAQAEQQVQQQRVNLENALKQIDQSDWSAFLQEGEQLLAGELAELANNLKQQSNNYGALQLPEQTIGRLNLRLPEPESVESKDFLEHAQLEQLKQQLNDKISQIQQMSESDTNVEQLNQHINRTKDVLQQLVQDRQAILSTPIPEIEHVIHDTTGQDRGRKIGQLLDMLMIIVPTKMVTTVASKVGVATKALATIQKAGGVAKVVAPVGQVLSMLSLAELGAKIGGIFDQAPQVTYQQDPELQAQIHQQAQQVHQQIQQLREDILQKEEAISQHNMTGFALQQGQREIQQMQQHAEKLQHELEQRQKQALEAQQQQQQETLTRYRLRAIEQWLSQFDTQSRSMLHLLQQLSKQYWQHSIERLFAARIAETESLQAQLIELPEQKQKQLALLKSDALAIDHVLSQLV